MIKRLLSILVALAFFFAADTRGGEKEPAPIGIHAMSLQNREDFQFLEERVAAARASINAGLRTGAIGAFFDAETASREALKIFPRSLPAQKTLIEALLGQRQFARALEEALKLQRTIPDDIELYGLVADAQMALGDYSKAEESVQWMLDLRPNHPAGLLRAALLRELFGDLDGAADFLNQSWTLIGPQQPELQAGVLTHLSRVLRVRGIEQESERLLKRSLEIAPGWQEALLHLAVLRESQDQPEQALELLRLRCRNNPAPEYLFDLASALWRLGHQEEARLSFKEFEKQALDVKGLPHNANVELVFYYTEYAKRPEEALAVARLEGERRRDMSTRHALAWALHANGLDQEARKTIQELLDYGVRDPQILQHAAEIEQGS